MENGSPAAAAPAPATKRPKVPAQPLPDDGVTPEDRRRSGKAHPYKPNAPDQIATFAQMWYDPAYTLDQIARRYHATERTVARWRIEFGLPERDNALKQAKTADNLINAAQNGIEGMGRMVALAQAPGAGGVVTPTVVPARFDPLQDPEITAALDHIRSEARIMSAHSDLQPLSRLLMRLSVISATKLPVATWTGLTVIIESLQRTILNARRIEADIPRGDADPVMLRREAAGQMMREMRSVLSPEEQAALATLVKAAADRLMARGAVAETLTPETTEAQA